jgi:hypothetical protein
MLAAKGHPQQLKQLCPSGSLINVVFLLQNQITVRMKN